MGGTQNTTVPSAGVLYVARVNLELPPSYTVTKIYVRVGTAGITLTNCYAGIYSSVGGLLARTADQSTVWTTASGYAMAIAFDGSGGAISSLAVTASAGTLVWVGLLVGSATTLPAFRAGANVADLINAGAAAGTKRFGQNGTGLVALPSSITPTSVTNTSFSPWLALGA